MNPLRWALPWAFHYQEPPEKHTLRLKPKFSGFRLPLVTINYCAFHKGSFIVSGELRKGGRSRAAPVSSLETGIALSPSCSKVLQILHRQQGIPSFLVYSCFCLAVYSLSNAWRCLLLREWGCSGIKRGVGVHALGSDHEEGTKHIAGRAGVLPRQRSRLPCGLA